MHSIEKKQIVQVSVFYFPIEVNSGSQIHSKVIQAHIKLFEAIEEFEDNVIVGTRVNWVCNRASLATVAIVEEAPECATGGGGGADNEGMRSRRVDARLCEENWRDCKSEKVGTSWSSGKIVDRKKTTSLMTLWLKLSTVDQA
jgi:hypothetical protein